MLHYNMVSVRRLPFPIRSGGRLALLAIVIQLLASFGHFHPLPLGGATVQTVTPLAGEPQGGLTDDDDCAVCANIAAFSGLAVPPPIPLPQRLAVRCTFHLPTAIASQRHCRFRLFHTRAPPAA